MDPLKRLRQELEIVLADLPKVEARQPVAGKWSPDQILEHLYLTYKNTNKGIARCIENQSPSATRATWKQRLGAFVLLKLGYFPKGRKAPERTVPRGAPPGEVRSSILSELQRMEAGLADVEAKFGAAVAIMDHPVLGAFTAAQWRKFHWRHWRHHVRQIRDRVDA